MLNTAKPTVQISLTLIKDSSLNIRRDFIEEKETQFKLSLKTKIDQCLTVTALPGQVSQQLTFTFSVVSDDGNLPSVLVAGASDLLSQLTNGKCAQMFSSMLLMHSGPPADENSSVASHAIVVDPTMEET